MNALTPINHRKQRPTPALDQFAELLSQEVSIPDAAQIMGFQRNYGKKLMKRLRRHLGWQAS